MRPNTTPPRASENARDAFDRCLVPASIVERSVAVSRTGTARTETYRTPTAERPE